jgi:enoyl-CoA hydratase
MSSPSPFTVTRRGKVAIVTMEDPPANAISDAWMTSFHAAIDELLEKADCSVLHIRSALRIFAAGSNLKQTLQRMESPGAQSTQMARVERIQTLFDRIESLPMVTLAEIGGAAMGGGLELALACDLRMVAREAKVGLPEVGLGLVPAAGGMQRVTALCGRVVASRLVLGAETIDGAEALALGLVQWAVPRAELEDRARETADRIATLPRDALMAAKRCLLRHDGVGNELDKPAAILDREMSAVLNTNAETLERVRAFVEKTRTTS